MYKRQPCVLSISSLPRPASTYQNASDSKSWKLVLVPSLLPSALAEYRLLHHLERMKHHRPDISSPELPRLLADLAAAEEAVHAPPTLRCDAEPLFLFSVALRRRACKPAWRALRWEVTCKLAPNWWGGMISRGPLNPAALANQPSSRRV